MPLLIPAVILFAAAITKAMDRRTAWGSVLGSLMVLVSFFYSIVHEDPAQWTDGNYA
ncbi:MAG: hypothetical protein HOB61_06160, partial [Actinobacteria bacterium]|nr:hypothetical protein [Actinomycetota bacterium]